jgi:hypothetical protein
MLTFSKTGVLMLTSFIPVSTGDSGRKYAPRGDLTANREYIIDFLEGFIEQGMLTDTDTEDVLAMLATLGPPREKGMKELGEIIRGMLAGESAPAAGESAGGSSPGIPTTTIRALITSNIIIPRQHRIRPRYGARMSTGGKAPVGGRRL